MFKIGHIEISHFPVLLAPLEDITDPPFRYLCKQQGADIVYSEFISSDGLIRDAEKSTRKLEFEEFERPVGLQIFGNNIESMQKAAEYAEKANPDIIDINFGCAVKKVASKGAGSGAMNDVSKMFKMTEAVVKSTHLPVTVKTRLGFDDKNKNIVEIAERLQDAGIQAITIHGRTRTMKYSQPADWSLIGEVKNNQKIKIPVIGNGDIFDAKTAMEKKYKYGVDAIMIGRAVSGYPWIFREIKHYLNTGEFLPPPNVHERVQLIKTHIHRSILWKGEKNSIYEMRRFYGDYFKGYPGFKPFKMQLQTLTSFDKVFATLNEIEKKYAR